MYKQRLFFIFILFLTPFTFTQSETGESIVLDPGTGDYIITYSSYTAEIQPALQRVVFVPATKIDPVIKSKFKLADGGIIVYSYKLRNSPKSRQNLAGFAIDQLVGVIGGSEKIPQEWRGGIFTSTIINKSTVGWSRKVVEELSGLEPGAIQDGFGFSSVDLPGIGKARLFGATPEQGFPDEGPDPETEVGKQFLEIQANDRVTRPAAVPLIPVPAPFNATTLLESLQTHIKTWVGMSLLDATLAAQLDRQFLSAITALQSGNTSAAQLYLKDLRQLIKKHRPEADEEDEDGVASDVKSAQDLDKKVTQKTPIDKLAAKVLAFDLKYVQKRLAAGE